MCVGLFIVFVSLLLFLVFVCDYFFNIHKNNYGNRSENINDSALVLYH